MTPPDGGDGGWRLGVRGWGERIPSPQPHIQQQQRAKKQQNIGREIPAVDCVQAAKNDAGERQLGPAPPALGEGRRGWPRDDLQRQRQREQAKRQRHDVRVHIAKPE
jgi:hypothetical protein